MDKYYVAFGYDSAFFKSKQAAEKYVIDILRECSDNPKDFESLLQEIKIYKLSPRELQFTTSTKISITKSYIELEDEIEEIKKEESNKEDEDDDVDEEETEEREETEY